MGEVAYITCRHGILWRVVNLWHPSRWRAVGTIPVEREFVCSCDDS